MLVNVRVCIYSIVCGQYYVFKEINSLLLLGKDAFFVFLKDSKDICIHKTGFKIIAVL